MATNALQSHGVDVLPPEAPAATGSAWTSLVLPVLLVLVLGAALARRRRQAAPLRRLRRDLARQHASPRQVGHRLATLVRQLPRVPADAVQTLQADLDALRFARDEPIAEAVATLIERAKALARGAANRHDR